MHDNLSIKRLAPGDEAILELLARDDGDFDVDGRGEALDPLSPEAARSYLADPSVLSWAAFEGEAVVGQLQCIVIPLRAAAGKELLFYEIGVRKNQRRRGIGRALLGAMEAWMKENGITVVWVLADNAEAVAFYRAVDFVIEAEQPVYMTRSL